MRGEVLQFSGLTGEGLISGDDGTRYRFGQTDISHGAPAWGSLVDFVPERDRATLVVVLQPGAFAMGNLPPPAPRLTPFGYFKRCCTTGYALGEGRAGMTEYWSFTLIHIAISLIFFIPFMALMVTAMVAAASRSSEAFIQVLPLAVIGLIIPYALVSLALLPPTVCVQIRRLHDIGLSGWWIMIAFVPFGSFALLIMALMSTQPGSNRFGHPPH